MPLRLLLDENMPGSAARDLREAGHDVVFVREDMQGSDDTTILSRAQVEGRVVVTMDKDFGELAVRQGRPATAGVVLFRLSGRDPGSDRRRILEIFGSRADWAGHFTVITEDRVRMRALPSAS